MVVAWCTDIRIGQVGDPAAMADTRLVLWTNAALSAALLILATMIRKLIDPHPWFRSAPH